MRESFGGAFMIKLILVFIVIYVSFMAVAVNYAKAFRVKNGVINILEQNQFIIGKDSISIVDNYLKRIPYNFNGNLSVKKNCYNGSFGSKGEIDGNDYVLTERGVCITKKGTDSDFYYEVVTYISIEFPFFDIYLTLPIKGETKTISVNS